MEKTRKERIKAVSNKRTTEQFNQTHLVYKRGTAVLSTTLLVGLLAFPSFSVSATANDLANSSNAKLESAKEVVEETTNEVEEVATEEQEEQEVQVLSGDALIEKEQNISDLKLLLSETQIEELNFEELTIDEIEELLIEALDVANKGSIESDDSSKVNDPPSTITVEKESLDIIAEDTLAAEKAATEQAVAEQTATEKATAEQVTAEQAATEKATAEQVTAEQAATAKAAADKLAAEKAATAKAAADKLAAEKAATAKAATAKAEQAKIYIVKSGDTLNKISKAHGISVAELKSWNKLSSDLIHPGDALAVNKSGSEVVKTSNEAINSNKGIEKMSNAEFINFIGAYAAEVAPKNNLYASVMIAQAALESGFGGSKLSSSPNHNLFGIKGSYQGQTVTMYTSEYSSKGGWIYIPQNFKKYPSHAESLQDNANLLKNGTNWDSGFYSGAWASNTKSFSEATAWLQGRYATDPSYASKLNRLINDYNLTRFDKGYTGGNTPTPAPAPEVTKPDSNTTVTSNYQVKRGDTLWGIATSNHVSVANLKSWNSLKSDVIYVGQKLTIKGTVTTPAPTPEVTKPDSNTTVTSSYQVKNGDSLWGIATSNHVSVASLKSWNNLKSDVIYVGQKLTIKGTVTTPAPTPEVTKPDSNTTVTSSYQVKRDDSLWGIATSNHVSVANLKAWNNLKSDVIYIGQKLTIKDSTPTVSGNTTTGTTVTTKPTATSDYQVKSGDTLWGIANAHNLSIVNLKILNNLKADTIIIGQKLIVQSDPQNVPVKENTAKSYKVSSGDSLWAIANKLNTSVVKLKEWNYLKTDIIFVGQSLIVK